ncbi:polyamine ABC transporter substrate-binding protein [Marinivivus vitaminiproducens]|uniref:polyamine ABC transporter substrate-binding protein n=1 Tax=Marinivivus vitaminiproducens TaxID=3035935 RepID=UPI0027A07AC9|nr:polyamine ABC transporter substrate-binding protein [Geminicoccaceae bacterium SCSIO 64248]
MIRLSALVAGFCTGGVALVATAHAQTLTVSSFGGAYQDAQRKAFFEPTAEALGVTIREETLTGLADVRLQVQSGNVTWDIADLGYSECAQGAREGLFEPLDYDVIDAEGIDPQMVADDWIGIIYYSTVIAYDTQVFDAETAPKTWADFFDSETFEGLRSLRNEPEVQLELALLADGVPRDQLYPLDVDRAFAKLEEIKPDIGIWWTSGAQSAQILRDREVDMVAAWNGRITAIKNDGASAEFTFNDGILNADCLVIPKGAPNKELAMKAIAMFVSPEQQAVLPTLIDYGPINAKAFEQGVITSEQAAVLPSSPDNMKNQVIMNAEWWAENGPAIAERWTAFIQQ